MNMAGINLSFEDFSNICRLCLMKKNGSTLIEHSLFLDILNNIIDFKLESDDLPKTVCNDCQNKLEYISSFINSCIKSEITLKTVLENHKLQPHSHQEKIFVKCFSPQKNEGNLNNKCEPDNHMLTSMEEIKIEIPEETLENIPVKPRDRKSSNCEKTEKSNTGRNPYQCTDCDKIFFTKFKLKVHMRSHTKETPYECKICLKKFRFASNVYRHVDVAHKGLKPFKCDVCGKEFSRSERKIQHMRIHTNNRPYECKFCGKTFRHKSSHTNHEMGHKIKNGEVEDLSEIKCNTCLKIFFSKSLLQAHIEIHKGERKFLCSVCGRGFLKKCYLDVHARVHNGEKPFECKECGKKFKHASSYKTHAVFHTGLRFFECPICSKTFKQSAHLKSHSRVHSGEKPFKCDICEKYFSQKSNLNAHTRIHTGETPYHCPICNKGFYDSSSMKKHIKNH